MELFGKEKAVALGNLQDFRGRLRRVSFALLRFVKSVSNVNNGL